MDDDSSRFIVEAAAAVTKESNKLLGIKSIGVDYGLARTGVAVTVGYSPKPLAIVATPNVTEVAREVVNYCRTERANQVVVGLPLHKNGTEAEQSNITRIFAMELARQSLQRLGPKVRIFLWDERYTSKEAAARAHSADPNRILYGTLDAEAACIILENYYEDNGISAEQVTLPEILQQECLTVWALKRQEEMLLRGSVDNSVRQGREEQRLESMERARKLEEELQKNGMLGPKKGKKKKREKRGPWIVPSKSEA
jgi:putative Holliday junction resolvase